MSWAAKALRAKLREVAALGPGAELPSPCVSVCRIDPQRGVCEGCLRTLDEIAAWSRLDEAGKRQVWQRLEARLKEQA